MNGNLSIIGIIIWILWGFFMGTGWWIANRILGRIFG